VAHLIPKQYSQLTSNHPSSLPYFHLPHPILSSVGLSWSINYIDLTPDRTVSGSVTILTKLPQQETGSHHHMSRGVWLNTTLPRLQVSEDKQWEIPPPLLIQLGSIGYSVGNTSTLPDRTRVNTLYQAILCNYCS
jgi:hypothetical protein